MKEQKFYPKTVKKEDIENLEDWKLMVMAHWAKFYKNSKEESLNNLYAIWKKDIYNSSEEKEFEGVWLERDVVNKAKDIISYLVPKESFDITRPIYFLKMNGFEKEVEKNFIREYNWKEFIVNYLKEKM